MSGSYRSLLWGLALVGLLLDQTSKYLVFHWQYNDGQGGQYTVVPGVFELLAQFDPHRESGSSVLHSLRTLSGDTLPRVNQGALFGWTGWGFPPEWSNSIFAVISLLAAAAIIYWSTQASLARDWSLCAALGLILAGTLGNLYDRVVFGGVRDFIHWHWYDKFDWPVFNIADCCLVVGAGLLLTQAFWQRSAVHEQQPHTDSAAESPMVAEAKSA
jgi:lipoprotein signal peptidase